MKNIAKVWDTAYQDSLYVDQAEGEGDSRGLQFTLTECGHTIVISPEQAKKLRLALARYERDSKVES